MTDHPITPPPELLQQWATEYWGNPGESIGEGENYIAIQSARWGADQQLAEDAKWLDQHALDAPHLKITPVGESLKEAMRPKPPSLAKRALHILGTHGDLSCAEHDTLRRALEQLDD